MSNYRPGFFFTLIASCSSSEFYARVREIGWKRTLGFLCLWSALLAALSLTVLWIGLSRFQANPSRILEVIQSSVPEFEAQWSGSELTTNPSQFGLFLDVSSSQTFQLVQQSSGKTVLRFSVDTKKTLTDAPVPEGLGLWIYRDGVVGFIGIQKWEKKFSDFAISSSPTSFKKQDLGSFLQSATPLIVSTLKNAIFRFGLMILFGYWFLSVCITSFLLFPMGLIVHWIRQSPLEPSFLLKLGLYTSIPGVVILLMTAFFATMVPFLPFFVQALYYAYGLRVSRVK